MSQLWETPYGTNDARVAIALGRVDSVIRNQDGWCRIFLQKTRAFDVQCTTDEYNDLLRKWNDALTPTTKSLFKSP